MTDFNAVADVARALHNALEQDIGVQDVLGFPPRLYDDPPEDPIFPYLTYGPIRSEDISADGARLTVHMMTLHIWSRYTGRAEALALMGVIAAAFNDASFTLSGAPGGAECVSRHIIYTDVFRASDGLTLHGLLRLRVTTDQELETI